MQPKIFDGTKTYSIKSALNPEILLKRIEAVQGDKNLYASVAWLYATMQWLANATTNVPLLITDSRGEVVPENDLPFNINLNDLIKKWSLSDSLFGASYAINEDGDIRYLNASTIKAEIDNMSGLNGFTRQLKNAKINIPIEQMVWNFRSDLQEAGPGLPPADVVSETAELLRFMIAMQTGFFERGGVPLTVITAPQGISKDNLDELKARFDKVVKGVKNFFNTIGVREGTTITQLTPQFNSMQMPELSESAQDEIFGAFLLNRVVVTGVTTSGALAGDSYTPALKQAYQTAVLPILKSFISSLNKHLFNDFGLTLQENHQAMSIFQADEAERSSSVLNLVNAGMPLNLALEILGYDLTPNQTDAMEAQQREAEPEVRTVSQLKLDEIGKLKKFIKTGKHLKRPFTSDILTRAEINHVFQQEGATAKGSPFSSNS